jgi:hypothetical protein
MPRETIENWQGIPIDAVRSRGGTWGFPDYADGLICGFNTVWPPHELVQKLQRSDKIVYFNSEDHELMTAKLGYYTDLQSANSEDSAVWNYFGTLSRASNEDRTAWLSSFLGLFCSTDPVKACEISLWRRVPHPDSLTSGGPEVDVCITTETEFVMIEAKWRASEGHWQGSEGLSSQMQLRSKFLEKLGDKYYPKKNLRLVYIMLDPSQTLPDRPGPVKTHCLLWTRIISETQHPHQIEVARYFRWKWSLAPRTSRQRMPDIFPKL